MGIDIFSLGCKGVRLKRAFLEGNWHNLGWLYHGYLLLSDGVGWLVFAHDKNDTPGLVGSWARLGWELLYIRKEVAVTNSTRFLPPE